MSVRFLSSCSLCLLGVWPKPLIAQFADSITTVRLAEHVYVLEGAGDVITASVGPDGVLLVDNGFRETVPAVRQALADLANAGPEYVINTHWHHSGANDAFASSATIVAHRRTRDRLRDGATMYTQEMPPRDSVAFPDIVFDDSLSLFFIGEQIDIIHLPFAHTDTDVAVIFTSSNVAALGDVFVPFIPVTDYGSGGDLAASLRAIEFLLQRLNPDTRVVPGHGRPSTYADLQGFHTMLTGLITYVERRIDDGWTVDQLVDAGIPDEWRAWRGELLTDEFVLQNLYEGVVRARAEDVRK